MSRNKAFNKTLGGKPTENMQKSIKLVSLLFMQETLIGFCMLGHFITKSRNKTAKNTLPLGLSLCFSVDKLSSASKEIKWN